MVKCAVPGCRTIFVKSGLRFFRFPSDSRRRELWRAFTRRDHFLPKHPKLCELHFDESQYELKRQDGWRKLKWSAVPTLNPPPSEHKLIKKHDQEEFTESPLKLADDGEEFQNDASVTSVDFSADLGKELDDQQDSEAKPSSRRPRKSGMIGENGTNFIRDKRVLQGLLRTIGENIQKFSCQLKDTTSRKSQLMNAVNALTQEEIELQRRLKKESDKENAVKQQLQEVEEAEKEEEPPWKVEEPCSEELDSLTQQNHNQNGKKENWNQRRVEEQCSKEISELVEKDSHLGSQIAAQKDNDLVAKNILRETSAAKQMELKLLDGLVAFSIVDNVQVITLKLIGDEFTNKNSDSLLKSNTNLTDSSNAGQSNKLTLLPESLSKTTNRTECDRFVRIAPAVSSVETASPDSPPMSLRRNHICSFCGKRFWNAGARHSHELTHEKKEFRCDVCDKVFPYRTGFINHMSTHSDEKPFGCTLCDRLFKTNGTLNRHFRSHTQEKRFVCSVCSEAFFTTHQRQVHMSVHTGKKPFTCQDCGRGFSSGNCLTRHVLIHRGEKPFECDVCGKRFRQGNQVKAHKEIHGEKPYVCSRCGKRLGLGSFWTHMKKHSGGSGIKIYYECAVCDKKLSTKKTLEMHTRMVHMGEAAYVCNICYKEFGKFRDFQVHKKEHSQCSS